MEYYYYEIKLNRLLILLRKKKSRIVHGEEKIEKNIFF